MKPRNIKSINIRNNFTYIRSKDKYMTFVIRLLNNYEIESKTDLIITIKEDNKTSISFKGESKVVLKS